MRDGKHDGVISTLRENISHNIEKWNRIYCSIASFQDKLEALKDQTAELYAKAIEQDRELRHLIATIETDVTTEREKVYKEIIRELKCNTESTPLEE